jgi:phosphoribosylanthranilate isomerase
MSTDINEILRMVDAVQPGIVHISSDMEAVHVPAMRQLRPLLPSGTLLMKAIHVAGPESIKAAQAFAALADILLLDTKVTGMPGVGATGVTHDWSISREIVRLIGPRAKVILAGGLVPGNVADAIRAVRPWGVDSNTGTNLPGDPVTKDWAKVAAFVTEARRVASDK